MSSSPLAPGSAGGSSETSACGAPIPNALTPALSRGEREQSGKEYWRSIDDLSDTPEFRDFVMREFPAAGEMLDSSDRRTFLKIMGASAALAGMGFGGLAGCRRWPDTKLAPYAHRPADRNPGAAVHYATSMEFAGIGAGLLVTTYDGRPIKLEGNPEHPINRGATSAIMQAAILDMYDPDRSTKPLHGGKDSTWEDFATWAKSHFDGVAGGHGSGLAFLSEATSSPSVQAMRQRIMARFPNASWHEYEAINNDNEVAGSMAAFGGGGGAMYRPMYDFAAAKTVVSLDCDFLNMHSAAEVKWCRDFAASRRCDNGAEPSRLYVLEGTLSLTGANADHRVALRSSDVARVAAWIASQVGVMAAANLPASLAAMDSIATLQPRSKFIQTLEALAADLKAGAGKPSIVIAGERQPPEVHLLAHLINRALGNVGKTITYAKIDGMGGQPHVQSLTSLVEKINGNGVQTLVMLGGNPVYNAPADFDFANLLKKVQTSIHLADYVDETSRAVGAAGGAGGWHVNRAHFLESWGDVRSYDGTWGISQPTIQPMFNGKTAAEVLAVIADEPVTSAYEITRAVFAANVGSGGGGTGEDRWRKALHDGFVEGTAFVAAAAPEVAGFDIAPHLHALEQRLAPNTAEMEVVFAADACMYDGRLANNGWMQELPDPISKLSWDNAVWLSPNAAKSRGVWDGSMVKVACNGKEVTAGVLVIPGQHDNVATLALGYGRDFDGRVAKDAGFNFYPLRTSGTMGFAGATITKAPGSYVMALTQDHHAIDEWPGGTGTQERMPTIFRESKDLAEFRKDPHFARHRSHIVTRLSLFPEDKQFQTESAVDAAKYPDRVSMGNYAWGMSIDLNSCTGCSACTIACQAENNIAIVGKDQVKRGRELHWIRVDRYFRGASESNPSGFAMMPVPCMHCENAPCEQVCPVAATEHDDSGLNVMVYNRCVGTRYCSNNCPYKVRRFNYFDYWGRGPLREQPGVMLQVPTDYYTKGQAKADPLRQLQLNPEVTVRMRGIMEKCTYCIQRIAKARITAKNAWVKAKNLNENDPAVQDLRVPIPDGTFTSACAQACPAKAITFGDLNDPKSAVKAMHRNPRAYELLEELNTKPRTKYLARVRNPAFSDETGHEAGAGEGGHGGHG